MTKKKQSVEMHSDVSIILKPNAASYSLEEAERGAVGFSAIIKNAGNETITIAHPMCCLPPSYPQQKGWHQSEKHGKSEILLTIKKPKGTTIILRDGPHFFEPGFVDHFTIAPNKVKEFLIGWFFLNARGRWENDDEASKVFLHKGTYKISILLRNSFLKAAIHNKATNKSEIRDVWTGEIQSKEVSIEIK